MTDELDGELVRAFASTAEPLPGDDFARRLILRAILRRRAQLALRFGAIAMVGVMAILTGHLFVRASLLAAERFGVLLVSPVGWTLSLLLAVAVLRRRRLLRR